MANIQLNGLTIDLQDEYGYDHKSSEGASVKNLHRDDMYQLNLSTSTLESGSNFNLLVNLNHLIAIMDAITNELGFKTVMVASDKHPNISEWGVEYFDKDGVYHKGI